MKFTLTIIPALFALSAFGSPVEPNVRQMQTCNLAQCISFIAAQPGAIISFCVAAVDNLDNIQQAQAQGKPPSQADQSNLASNSLRCIAASVAAGFAIPAACNSCLASSIPS